MAFLPLVTDPPLIDAYIKPGARRRQPRQAATRRFAAMIGLIFVALFILVGLAVLLGLTPDSRVSGKWWPGEP
jgi:hypothetical protein